MEHHYKITCTRLVSEDASARMEATLRRDDGCLLYHRFCLPLSFLPRSCSQAQQKATGIQIWKGVEASEETKVSGADRNDWVALDTPLDPIESR